MVQSALDHTVVDTIDMNYTAAGIGFRINGGPLAAAGTPAEGRVRIWSGSGSSADLPYNITTGGNLLSHDTWFEGNSLGKGYTATGPATVTVEGGQMGITFVSGSYTHDLQGLNEKYLVLSQDMAGFVGMHGDGTNSQVLLDLVHFSDCTAANNCPAGSIFFFDSASPPGTTGAMRNMQQDFSLATDSGTQTDSFIRSMMAQARVLEPQVQTTPAGGE